MIKELKVEECDATEVQLNYRYSPQSFNHRLKRTFKRRV